MSSTRNFSKLVMEAVGGHGSGWRWKWFDGNRNSCVGGGEENSASDKYSFVAGGFTNLAAGEGAFVGGGQSNTASGAESFVGGGSENVASGPQSYVGGGISNTAGVRSYVAGGSNNEASGLECFVGGGISNTASGICTFVGGGFDNRASGEEAFIGGERGNQAAGEESFVGGGRGNIAVSFGEAVFGLYSTNYTALDSFSFNANDRLFVIGNGTSSLPNDHSNAMTVLKNGNVGLGTDNPSALLHTMGDSTMGGSVLLAGTYNSSFSGPLPASGAGTRLMWIPEKAAFRVGRVLGGRWDLANIGDYSSVAGGDDNIALGIWSFVGGGKTNGAYSDYSFVGGGTLNTAAEHRSSVVGGGGNAASGEYSFVGGGAANAASEAYSFVGGGLRDTASGEYSFVGGGHLNTASGAYSFVGGGAGNSAPSYGETVFGLNNTTYVANSPTAFWNLDRLFVIGNGSNAARSNAVTVLKSGNTIIGGDDPGDYKLKIKQGGFSYRGLNIENSGSDDWELWVHDNGHLELWANGSMRGHFNKNSGVYAPISDARLKTAVQPMRSVLSILKKLKPSSYAFTSDDENRRFLGFLAQEVEPFFPELVRTPSENDDGRPSYYTMDYAGFGVVAVKAIQEQQAMIEAQAQKIVDMENEIASLKSDLSAIDAIAKRITYLENVMHVPIQGGSKDD